MRNAIESATIWCIDKATVNVKHAYILLQAITSISEHNNLLFDNFINSMQLTYSYRSIIVFAGRLNGQFGFHCVCCLYDTVVLLNLNLLLIHVHLLLRMMQSLMIVMMTMMMVLLVLDECVVRFVDEKFD